MPIALRDAPQGEDHWGSALNAEAREGLLRDVFGLTLIPWQKRLFDEVGGPVRPKVYYVSIPRKSGKSYCLAAFILTELMLEPVSAIYIFSDSERNSKAVLFHELISIVALCHDPTLFSVHYDKVVYNPTGGFVMVRPSNVAAVQGINPTMCCVDEVHLQRNDFVWNGAIMAGAARPQPLLLATTTPGYDVTSLAHTLHESVLAGETPGIIYQPEDRDGAYEDRGQWAMANPGLGYTFELDNLEADHRLMPEHEFRRFRLGQWTATASAWLPYGVWDGLADGERVLSPGEDVWLGFDGSYSGDSTALVACSRDGFVSVLGLWENPGRRGWRVPREQVKAAVHGAFAEYNVIQMFVDPPYWGAEIAEWDQLWPRRVVEFPTFSPANMSPACTSFYAAVMDARLTHDGDARLTRHIANCVVKDSPRGQYVTKQDKDSPAKIDAAVAAILAFQGAAVAPAKRGVGVFF